MHIGCKVSSMYWTSQICDHESPDPPGRPTQDPCHFIPFHKRRNVATNNKATQPTYASTSTCLRPRQQAPLSLEREQHIFRRSQAQKSPLPATPPPPNINHPHQLHYQNTYRPRHNWLTWPHISQWKLHCLWETTQKQVHSKFQKAHHSPK